MNLRRQRSTLNPAALLLALVAMVWALLLPVTAKGDALPDLLSGGAHAAVHAQKHGADPSTPMLMAPELQRTDLSEVETWEPDDEIGSGCAVRLLGVLNAVTVTAVAPPTTGYIPTLSRLPLRARAPPRP